MKKLSSHWTGADLSVWVTKALLANLSAKENIDFVNLYVRDTWFVLVLVWFTPQCNNWPSVSGIYRWPVDSPVESPIMRTVYPSTGQKK